jgi:hypothetical protein
MKTTVRSFFALTLILSIFLSLQLSAHSECSSSSSDNGVIIYVNINAKGTNMGNSWKNAFTNLQSALDEAASIVGSKQIWIAKGTYVPTKVDPFAPRSITPTFLIPDLTHIFGGFKGDEECVKQRHLTQPSKTILSGLSSPQANHVVTLDNVSVRIDGVTIRDGLATNGAGNVEREDGGGIFIYSGNTLLNHVALLNNQAISSVGAGGTGVGGALYASRRLGTDPAPVIIIDNALVDSNFANRLGGGMFFAIADVEILNSSFENNHVLRPFPGFGQGGAFQISEGNATVIQSVFRKNRAESSTESVRLGLGGAIYNFGQNNSTVTIHDCKFFENFATGQGGALYNNSSARMYVFNSLVDGNSVIGSAPVVDGGGGVANQGSDFALIDCTFSNNSAVSKAGAIYILTDGSSFISGCKIINNHAVGPGGGINHTGVNLQIENSLIEGNTSETRGGGIDVAVTLIPGVTLIMAHSKVCSNSAPIGGGISNAGTVIAEKSEFSKNRALIVDGNAVSGQGGGFFNRVITAGTPPAPTAGLIDLYQCKCKDNKADVNGGAVFADQNTSLRILENCFYRNSAVNNGGALFGSSLSFLITQNKFIRNSAQSGGAIFYTNALTTPFTANIIENVFSNNKASISGGAIELFNAPSSDVNIFNNIFCKNKSPQGKALSIESSSTDVVGNAFKGDCDEDCCIFYSNSSINDKSVGSDINTYLRFLNTCN